MLYIYNTLTRKKEAFKPLNPDSVGIYTCGVTVYDDCHIGHGRSLYIFEVIRRYLKFKGYKVTFVRNITDIDDKILVKCREYLKACPEETIDKAWKDLTSRYIESYYRDLSELGIEKADVEPKASGHIPDIIGFIKTLIEKGYAYEAKGSVYFRVKKYRDDFSSYGELSGKKDLNSLFEGVRIDINSDKEDSLDFALWKTAKENEVSWDSPWGKGRPGWHIECSVMAEKYLGEDFDIHGGGRDLIFPHHENEIAQAKAKSGRNFARVWIHHGLITVNNQKMSKSLKNFITLHDAVTRYSAETLKILYLSSHYRSPSDFSQEKIDESSRVKERISILIRNLSQFEILSSPDKITNRQIKGIYKEFIEAMDDDFNMPLAFSKVFDLIALSGKQKEQPQLFFSELKTVLYKILILLDIFPLGKKVSPELLDFINQKIAERALCRKNKEFSKADSIRDELDSKGVVLEDSSDGTTLWRVKEINEK